MPKPTSTLTPETILAHERLHPRVAALPKQVERVAAQPIQPVPAESLKLARELCQEAAQLLGREERGRRVNGVSVAAAACRQHAGTRFTAETSAQCTGIIR